MTFKKVAYKLHLWLGLISGIIVFIVCITGAIWALRINGWVGDTAKDEIECLPTQQNQKLLLPSQLVAEASAELGTTTPNNINYTKDKSTSIAVWGKNYKSVDINPYTGTLIKDTDSATVSSDSFNFWRFIGSGHRSLWLPWEIGRPIVNYGTLLFVIVLITGLIIWFPKSKKAAKNRLWFNWKKNTPAKRKIIDLHHVVGFYSCFLLLVIAFTGMVWGIQWWSKGLYSLTTGGKELPAWGAAKSDTTYVDTSINLHDAIDEVFVKLVEENPKAYSISINYPDTINKTSVIKATISKRKGGYYDSDYYDFDRYTLQPIAVVGPYSGKYEDASFGDKLRRMNYEIHIGSIAGTPGRILVFFAAIFGASLPVTGVYIFFKTRKKRKNR